MYIRILVYLLCYTTYILKFNNSNLIVMLCYISITTNIASINKVMATSFPAHFLINMDRWLLDKWIERKGARNYTWYGENKWDTKSREREREREANLKVEEMCKLVKKRVKYLWRSHTAYDKCLKVCTWRPNY